MKNARAKLFASIDKIESWIDENRGSMTVEELREVVEKLRGTMDQIDAIKDQIEVIKAQKLSQQGTE